MARVCSILTLLLACFVTVGTLRADDAPAKKHRRQSPEQRFEALEKAANHDPLTGVLTKDEFVKSLKATAKDSKMADKAETIYDGITKADNGKVTKEEFVTSWKEHHKGHGKKKDKDADSSK